MTTSGAASDRKSPKWQNLCLNVRSAKTAHTGAYSDKIDKSSGPNTRVVEESSKPTYFFRGLSIFALTPNVIVPGHIHVLKGIIPDDKGPRIDVD